MKRILIGLAVFALLFLGAAGLYLGYLGRSGADPAFFDSEIEACSIFAAEFIERHEAIHLFRGHRTAERPPETPSWTARYSPTSIRRSLGSPT